MERAMGCREAGGRGREVSPAASPGFSPPNSPSLQDLGKGRSEGKPTSCQSATRAFHWQRGPSTLLYRCGNSSRK